MQPTMLSFSMAKIKEIKVEDPQFVSGETAVILPPKQIHQKKGVYIYEYYRDIELNQLKRIIKNNI